eukprot:CAMPEP_0170064162 /NCGR_PEP_ID=MMETSP0019_2-20121128/4750_1 /TAXON_ID=98059 /ORGANISM="Dinobryon sp., Strain UTEXLB2267" /LENGTH=412 /DNA_ID=CAMNT_0010270757 /DNA_START=225 /DNA_END=1460 /DNA_ORIENTATION=+
MLREIFSSVRYEETDCIHQFLDSHRIQIVPCVVLSSVAGINFTDTYPLQTINKLTEMKTIPVSEQFTKSLEFYNNFDMIGALRGFSYLLLDEPNHSGALFNSACILHMIGYPTLAIPYLQRVLIQDPNDSITHSFLWALASNSDGFCLSTCMQCYRTLAENGDVAAIVKLATLTGDGEHASHGDPNYARKIYDDMADSFEHKLVDKLGYDAPSRLLQMLQDAMASSDMVGLPVNGSWRVLDLGCGSGLVGRTFASLTGLSTPRESEDIQSIQSTSDDVIEVTETTKLPICLESDRKGPLMVGVDVSAKIGRIALKSGGYNAVLCCDLLDALRLLQPPAAVSQHLVVAADTFIYVGALGKVFQHVRTVLAAMGLFLFTTEHLLDESPEGDAIKPPISTEKEDAVEIAGAVPGW